MSMYTMLASSVNFAILSTLIQEIKFFHLFSLFIYFLLTEIFGYNCITFILWLTE